MTMPSPGQPDAEVTAEKRFLAVYYLVAALFLVFGALSLLGGWLSVSPVTVAVGFLDVIVGVGLLLRVQTLWTVALFLIWVDNLALFVLLLFVPMALLTSGAGLVGVLVAVVLLVRLGINFWSYGVLIRPDVCACYYEG